MSSLGERCIRNFHIYVHNLIYYPYTCLYANRLGIYLPPRMHFVKPVMSTHPIQFRIWMRRGHICSSGTLQKRDGICTKQRCSTLPFLWFIRTLHKRTWQQETWTQRWGVLISKRFACIIVHRAMPHRILDWTFVCIVCRWNRALELSSHVTDIRDVLTARLLALVQVDLETKGVIPRRKTVWYYSRWDCASNWERLGRMKLFGYDVLREKWTPTEIRERSLSGYGIIIHWSVLWCRWFANNNFILFTSLLFSTIFVAASSVLKIEYQK